MYDDCSGHRAVLWRDGRLIPLPGVYLGAEAFDINDAGDVVGYSWSIQGSVAMLWRQAVPIDLNRYVSPETGWYLTRANAVAGDGAITGIGDFRGRSQAFVLRPPGAQG
jgi:probable HAF family extracellular repeat protein